MRITKEQQALLSAALRELGRRGGKASAAALTPEQRRARAVKAGQTRQAKARARKAAQNA
jgi:hypothetical protein